MVICLRVRHDSALEQPGLDLSPMSTKNSQWLLSTALLWGIGALLLVLILEWLWFTFYQGDETQTDSAPVNIRETQALAIRDIGIEQDFQEILERPLFIWSRKPLANDSSTPQTQTSDIESRWELSGIVAAGATHYAYFRPVAGGERSRFEEGMYFEKWQVKAIEPEQVILVAEEGGVDDSDTEQKIWRMKETIKPVKSNRARSILAKRKERESKQAEVKRKPKNSPDTEKPAEP